MYCEFYQLRERPFNVTSDPKFLYLNSCYREALASLSYGITQRKGFIALIGEAGTGKTTLLKKLLDDLDSTTRTVFLFNTNVTFDEILEYIFSEFDLPIHNGKRLYMLQRLNAFLLEELRNGRNVALLVDEAQDLDFSVMEDLRLLSNLETSKEKILQIVLSGQPELGQKLGNPNLRQLRQRVAINCRLQPLARDEVTDYIEARLQAAGATDSKLFSRDAEDRIYEISKGIPRVINVVCDNALVIGYALGKKRIGADIIKEAAADLFPADSHVVATESPASNLRARALPSIEVGRWRGSKIAMIAVVALAILIGLLSVGRSLLRRDTLAISPVVANERIPLEVVPPAERKLGDAAAIRQPAREESRAEAHTSELKRPVPFAKVDRPDDPEVARAAQETEAELQGPLVDAEPGTRIRNEVEGRVPSTTAADLARAPEKFEGGSKAVVHVGAVPPAEKTLPMIAELEIPTVTARRLAEDRARELAEARKRKLAESKQKELAEAEQRKLEQVKQQEAAEARERKLAELKQKEFAAAEQRKLAELNQREEAAAQQRKLADSRQRQTIEAQQNLAQMNLEANEKKASASAGDREPSVTEGMPAGAAKENPSGENDQQLKSAQQFATALVADGELSEEDEDLTVAVLDKSQLSQKVEILPRVEALDSETPVLPETTEAELERQAERGGDSESDDHLTDSTTIRHSAESSASIAPKEGPRELQQPFVNGYAPLPPLQEEKGTASQDGPEPVVSGKERSVTALPGDSLSSIAEQKYGAANYTVLDLMRMANPAVRDVDEISAGQKINVPRLDEGVAVVQQDRGDYAVLVMSTPQQRRANDLEAALRKRGFHAEVRRTNFGNGETVYRLLMPGFRDRTAAVGGGRQLQRMIRDDEQIAEMAR